MTDYTLPFPLWKPDSDIITKEKTEKQVDDSSVIFSNGSGNSFWATSKKSEWDSKHSGLNVIKITSLTDQCLDYKTIDFSNWIKSIPKPALVWVRLAMESSQAIRTLEENRFIFVSGLQTFKWIVDKESATSSDINIRRARDNDIQDIGQIASEAFIYDRLYLDPQISHDTASRMYADWSMNCVKGLCDTVLVYEKKGCIAGFVTLIRDKMFSETLGYKCLRLLLIAVGKDFYRLGVGRSLVNAAKRVTVEEDYKTLLVGTSSINIPAQNLYISCGFYPYYSELSMEKLTR